MEELEGIEILRDEHSLSIYSTDASIYEIKPKMIVYPRNEEEVSRILRYCFSRGIPVIPRGGGTALPGQSIGNGVIIDFTKYMNRILEIGEDYVVVQPGITLSELNKALRKRVFPPEPASGDQCTIGGMIANNASGGRSLRYGATIDHVISLKVVLSNGEIVEFKKISEKELSKLIEEKKNTLEGQIYEKVPKLIEESMEEIKRRTPQVPKNCSGYRVERFVSFEGEEKHYDFPKLIISSEGTLGVVVEAKLRTISLPEKEAVLLIHFDDLEKASSSVVKILKEEPIALELMDESYISLVRERYPEVGREIPEGTKTILLVKLSEETEEELKSKVKRIKEGISGLFFSMKESYEKEEQERLWEVRRVVASLVNKMKGPKRVINFIEDGVVVPERIPDYIRGVKRILDKYGVKAIIYGHAGEGNFHTSPLLDLKLPEERDKFKKIAEEFYSMILELNGSISGEHGDGILRARFVREMYGEELYSLFRKIKEVFDPKGIMNPGKIIETRRRGEEEEEKEEGEITSNLRFYDFRLDEFDFKLMKKEEVMEEVERCNGCGKCRSIATLRACPLFKIKREERYSPRGIVNTWRRLLKEEVEEEKLFSKAFYEYCILCQQCEMDCPAEIRVPDLVIEGRWNFRRWLYRLLPYLETIPLDRFPLVRIMNGFGRAIGLTRELPRVRGNFYRWYLERRDKFATSEGEEERIVYFPDVYTNYFNPELAKATFNLLRRKGFKVEVYNGASGIISLLSGDLKKFDRISKRNSENLKGETVVSNSPSAVFALRKYLEDVYELGQFLLERKIELDLLVKAKISYFLPCYTRALGIGKPFLKILKEIGAEVEEIDKNCCGRGIVSHLGNPVSEEVSSLLRDLSEKELIVTECEWCLDEFLRYNERVAHPVMLVK